MNSGILVLTVPIIGLLVFFFSGGNLVEFIDYANPWLWGLGLLLSIGVAKALLFPTTSDDDMRRQIMMPVNIGRSTAIVEPKRGRHGTTLVYKRLTVMSDGKLGSLHARGSNWRWDNMQLEADQIPTMENTNGIYGFHSPTDPELDAYRSGITALVEIELHGQRVLHQSGSRGQFGRIRQTLSVDDGVEVIDGKFQHKKG